MNKYYCVTKVMWGNGKVTADISCEWEGTEKPHNTINYGKRLSFDRWYDNRIEAIMVHYFTN